MGQEQDDFGGAKPITPPSYLFGRVVSRIKLEKNLRAERRKTFYAAAIFSLTLAIFSATTLGLGRPLKESGVMDILPFLLTDPLTTLASWDNLILFFLESMPVIPLVLFLAGILSVLYSLKYLAKHGDAVLSLSKSLKAAN